MAIGSASNRVTPTSTHRAARFTLRSTVVLLAAGALALAGAVPAHAEGDTEAPTAEAFVLAGVLGGDSGYIRQGTSFLVCARNVTDAGEPASGVASVTADVSSVQAGAVAEPLYYYGGAFPCLGDGTMFEWATYYVAAEAVLAEGSYPFSITLTDYAGNSRTLSSSVTVDNTPPSGVDVQTGNRIGGTAGKAEQGDTVTFTYSEPMNWGTANYAPYEVVARIDNNGSNDTLTVWNSPNSTLLYLGSVSLGGNYVSGNRTFGASGTASTLFREGDAMVVTLGTPSGSTGKVTSNTTMSWTPHQGSHDRAGNNCLTATVTETGPADREF